MKCILVFLYSLLSYLKEKSFLLGSFKLICKTNISSSFKLDDSGSMQ